MKFTRVVEIKDSELVDLLITAVEGGIGYWARVYEYVWEGDPKMALVSFVEFESAQEAIDANTWNGYADLDAAWDRSDERIGPWTHCVTIQTLGQTIVDALSGHYGEGAKQHALDYVSGDYDAITADVLIQCASIGEVRYG